MTTKLCVQCNGTMKAVSFVDEAGENVYIPCPSCYPVEPYEYNIGNALHNSRESVRGKGRAARKLPVYEYKFYRDSDDKLILAFTRTREMEQIELELVAAELEDEHGENIGWTEERK